MMFRNLLPIMLAALGTAGCTSLENVDRTMTRSETTSADASHLVDRMTATQAKAPRPAVVFDDQPLVDLRPMAIAQRLRRDQPLGCNITFAPMGPMDLLTFSQTVTRICGLPVRVTPDALAVVAKDKATPNTGANTQPGIPPLPQAGPPPLNSNAPQAAPSPMMISGIRWANQPLEGLLDVVTSRLGLNWSARDGVIKIYYTDTRTFRFLAIASDTEMDSVVQSGTTTTSGVGGTTGGTSDSGGVSGESGSSQTTSVKIKSSIAADLTKSIQSMLSPGLGRMSMSLSTGTVTVTDTPDVLSRIDEFLELQNKTLMRQVLLNVKVLSVTLEDKDSLGIDWTLVYKSIGSELTGGLTNVFPIDPGASSGSIGIIPNASGSLGRWAGSTATINALAKQGRVSTVTSPSVTTLNLQPVPVQVARQTSYLASVSTTNTPDVGSQTSLTPGTVTTGFNMNLLPYVTPDDRLLLQYSINLSSLQNLRSVSSGDNTIEIPEVDNRIFSQRVRLRSGETLILSGFEQTIDNGVMQGVGDARNLLLGGGRTADNRREVIVVLITPVVMD